MYKFKFADIGEGLHEGTVGKIYVKEGSKVNEGDSLFSIKTDKVTSDIPCPVTGEIKDILIKTGDKIHVGDEIFYIDDGSQDDKKIDNATSKESQKEKNASESGAASVVGSIEVSNKEMATFKNIPIKKEDNKRVFATPYARKLAAKMKIDINDVPGSGNNGRVLARDIENYQKTSNFAQPQFSSQKLEPFIKPISGMRKAIANAMVNSWKNVAYTNLSTEVNMTKLWEERKALVKHTENKYGIKVSFTALIAIATIKILYEFPELNSKYFEKANVLKHDGVINLGIAVDTAKGLIVPVIKNAHTKNVVTIAQEILELATKAREGKLTKEEMQDGTFTLTNYGSVGAMFGVPVINYPEIGILGIGTITDRVFANANGNFYNGKVMYLSLAADHQWVDGADIGRFITRIKELLENPILLLGGYDV